MGVMVLEGSPGGLGAELLYYLWSLAVPQVSYPMVLPLKSPGDDARPHLSPITSGPLPVNGHLCQLGSPTHLVSDLGQLCVN
jgi:hypothetical protein